MKNKKMKLKYPVQLIFAISWIILGLTWLFSQPLTWGSITISSTLFIFALLVILDCTSSGHRLLTKLLSHFLH